MKKGIRERATRAKGAGLSRMMRVGNLWVTRLRRWTMCAWELHRSEDSASHSYILNQCPSSWRVSLARWHASWSHDAWSNLKNWQITHGHMQAIEEGQPETSPRHEAWSLPGLPSTDCRCRWIRDRCLFSHPPISSRISISCRYQLLREYMVLHTIYPLHLTIVRAYIH